MLLVGLSAQRLSTEGGVSGKHGDPIALILLIIGIPVSFYLLSFRKREY
jgi:hypothetical protein